MRAGGPRGSREPRAESRELRGASGDAGAIPGGAAREPRGSRAGAAEAAGALREGRRWAAGALRLGLKSYISYRPKDPHA